MALKKFAFVLAFGVLAAGAAEPIPYLSPEESAKHFQLPPGYRMEPVVTEPDIREPVLAVFDGNGRMFVAEMRTYMQDIDATKEHEPVSRVSMHWSSKGDGKFDRHSVFIDKLLLPRMVLPLDRGILVNETDTNAIYYYEDTDGDGVADKKELWLAGDRRGGNLEHQPSGMIWCMDNWIYFAVNATRLRWQPNGPPLREPTAPNGGQWGLAQDDYGKQWIVNAGGEIGPLNFQQPIVYGNFSIRGEIPEDYREVYPLVGLADVQGGIPRFRPEDKTLNHFTAACGEEVFRGDQLPEELRGDLFFGEPVGRLIRRSKIEVRDGVTYLRNPHPKSEFLRSTDPNFRPINMTTAPDGTMYVVDMYRGIIQEGNWTQRGSYLRGVIQKYDLDKNFGRGRIWRLVHETTKPVPQPRMIDEKPAQLVAHLAHPNGWWRDTAQKLLVLRQDKSVVPALEAMVRTHANPLARLHALWTLEGLDAATPEIIHVAMKDKDAHLRSGAIRVSETLYKKGDKSFEADVRNLLSDPDPEVEIQAMMTAHLLKFPNEEDWIKETINGNRSLGVREIGKQLIEPRVAAIPLSPAERKLMEHGQAIYKELCFACHGDAGQGAPLDLAKGLTLAPPLAGSRTVLGHPDGVVSVLLHGLTGPVNGKKYDALMVPMASNDDEWIASVASYVRNSFGNRGSFVRPEDVARLRRLNADRGEPWTVEELAASLPKPLSNRKEWKLTASHRGNTVTNMIDGNVSTRWDTGASQTPGMWVQVELPAEAIIAGIELDSRRSASDYPRGYTVQTSDDGVVWREPIAKGRGTNPLTLITFEPVKTKFLRITQTGSVNGLFWSIHELHLFGPGQKIAKAKSTPAKSEFE